MRRTLYVAAALLLPGAAFAAPLVPQETWTFGGHRGDVAWAGLTPGGERVYTQSGPQLLTWDAHTGALLRAQEPAGGQPLNVLGGDWSTAVAPAGRRALVVAGEDQAARLRMLELESGTLGADFGPLPSGHAEWTPGQTAVALAGYGAPQVRTWRQSDGGQVRSLTLDSADLPANSVPRAALAPDGGTLYVLGRRLAAYDPVTSRPLWWLEASGVPGRSGQPLKGWEPGFSEAVLSHNPARPQLLLSSAEGLLLLNTQGDPAPLWLDPGLSGPGVAGLYVVDWSADGRRLFLSIGGYVHEVDAATGQTLGVLDGDRVLAQTPQRVWTALGGVGVAAFDRRSGLDVARLTDSPAWNSPAALGSGGEPAAVLVRSGSGLSVQELTGDGLGTGRRIPLNDHFTRAAAFSPDGSLVASVGPAGVQAMDAENRAVRWQVAAQDAYALAFAPSGKLLALGERGRTRLLDPQTGREVAGPDGAPDGGAAALRPPQAAAERGARGLNRALAFSPDSRQLAVGYEAGAVTVWDVASRRAGVTVSGGRGWVLSAAFSPPAGGQAGGRLALGDGSGEVRIYRLPGGEPLGRFSLRGAVRALAFGPDGSLAAGSLGGDLRRWDAGGRLTLSAQHPGGVTALAYAGGNLVVGTAGGDLAVYAPGAAAAAGPAVQTGSLVQSLDWNPQRRTLLGSFRDNTLRFYTLETP